MYLPGLTFGAFAAAAVLYLTNGLPLRLTPDSASYLAAGRGLAAGKGLLDFDGSPFVQWPPAFPALVSLFSVAGVDEVSGMRVLNALLLGAIAFLAWICALRITARPTLAAVATSLVVANPWLLLTHSHFWSDPLFVFLIVVFIVVTRRAVDATSAGHMIPCGAIAALAPVTRYIGVAIVVAGVAATLLGRRRKLVERIRIGFLLAAVAAVPICSWFARNWWVAGSPTGDRSSTVDTAASVAATIGNRLIGMFLPGRLAADVPLIPFFVFALVVATSLGATSVAAYRSRGGDSHALSMLAAIVLVVYLTSLWTLATVTVVDPIDERLLAPLVVPFALVWASLASSVLKHPDVVQRSVGSVLLVLVAFSTVTMSVVRSLEIHERLRYPQPASAWWLRESELSRMVTSLPPERILISNDPGTVFVMSGRNASYSPRRTRYRSTDYIADLELRSLRNLLVAEPSVTLIWFSYSLGTEQLGLNELRAEFRLDPLSDTEVAKVFDVRPR